MVVKSKLVIKIKHQAIDANLKSITIEDPGYEENAYQVLR